MRTGTCLLYLSLMIALLVSLGCNNNVEGRTRDQEGDPSALNAPDVVLIPVQAAQPSRQDISSYFVTTTRVQADNRVDVLSKGTGQCMALLAEEGDTVNKGQVLAELDKEELEAQIRQTRVNVEQQKTSFEIAARSLEEGIGSKVERDNAEFAYKQALATLQGQEVQLKHQTIRAPISGLVTARNIQEGMLVSSGAPAFSIVDPESYVLPITPPERELPHLHIGQEAKVTIDSYPDREFLAQVRRINPSVDPTSGTVKVLLDFDPDHRQYLREAAFARVRLIMETHPNALIIPKDALIEENARKYVMIVEEAAETSEAPERAAEEASGPPSEAHLIAERIEVQTGLEDSDNIEILSGIDDASRIVTLGQHTLKAGTAVTITNADALLKAKEGISPEEALASAREKRPDLK